MTKTLAILHTTPVTIGPLQELAKKTMPDCQIYSLLDDSILPQLIAGQRRGTIILRVQTYVKMAELTGADGILSACSSIGQWVMDAGQQVSVPVMRIDEAMAEEAVQGGGTIGILATLTTTLEPTTALVRAKADAAGIKVQCLPKLAAGAYEAMLAGDQAAHDERVAQALRSLLQQCRIVVLAQASMARVAAQLDDVPPQAYLTSPASGMQRVKQVLYGGQT